MSPIHLLQWIRTRPAAWWFGPRRVPQRLREEERHRNLERVIDGLAHDLDNLLTVVRGHGSLLERDEGLPEWARLDGGAIAEASRRAERLTDRLRHWSRGGCAAPLHVEVDEHLRSLLGVLRGVGGPQVAIDFEPEAELPTARVEPVALDQIVLNLVANSREAGASAIRLTLRGRNEIRPRRWAGGQLPMGRWVTLEVEDDGEGMSPATLRSALRPHFSTRGERRGIGLSTVRELAQASGGAIELESQLGQGTCATLWLPQGGPSSGTRAPGQDD